MTGVSNCGLVPCIGLVLGWLSMDCWLHRVSHLYALVGATLKPSPIDPSYSLCHTVDGQKSSMTLRTLNYGNYGIFLLMGHAGFCPSTVPLLTFLSAKTPKPKASTLSWGVLSECLLACPKGLLRRTLLIEKRPLKKTSTLNLRPDGLHPTMCGRFRF